MGADLHAVGSADEHEPGEQVGGQLQSPDGARVEHVAGDDLAEGDQHHAAEEKGDEPFLQPIDDSRRSEEHTSELQSLMRISYAVFCLKKKKKTKYKYRLCQ